MNEQVSNKPNFDPAAAEAVKPYDDLARSYIEANAALNEEAPEEFSAYLDEFRAAPNEDNTSQGLMETLDNIAEIGSEAARSADFRPQLWQRDYLAAIEAKTEKTRAVTEMDYAGSMEESSGREEIANILYAMSKDRHARAAAAADPAEKSRLTRESRELSRFVRLRDKASNYEADYDGAANEYYQACKASGEIDREGHELVAEQIDPDTLFVKYMPEAISLYRGGEQGQDTSPSGMLSESDKEALRKAGPLSDEQVAAEKAKLERLSNNSGRSARSEGRAGPAEQPASAETEHDQALRDKAAKILREARTSEKWKELGDRRYGEDGLNAKIREERRRGVSDGPAAQEARRIREIEKNQYFHTRTPEDIPKMFELLGLTSDVMKQRAEEMATYLREHIQNAEPGRIVYCNIGFAKNKRSGRLEPGFQMIGNPLSNQYIDET
jgi:hypothetical protein